jgi:hypothetical protein
MPPTTFTIIDDGRPVQVQATIEADHVRLSPESVKIALGWDVEPEGLCRDGLCVPIPPGTALVDGGAIDLRALASVVNRPLAIDAAERAAYLGVSAGDRARALTSLRAPDFTLPDLDGRPHSLSEHRGKKILLVAYASW